jgi:hypothetical protein
MTTAKSPPRRSKGPIASLLTLALIASVVMPTAVLLGVGLLPTVVAFFVDRDQEKSAGLTVGAMNVCGLTPFMIDLWQRGHDMSVALTLLTNPASLALIYGAAGFGWMLYAIIPQAFLAIHEWSSQDKVKQLETERAELVAQWGPTIGETEIAKGRKGQ